MKRNLNKSFDWTFVRLLMKTKFFYMIQNSFKPCVYLFKCAVSALAYLPLVLRFRVEWLQPKFDSMSLLEDFEIMALGS